MMDEVAKEERGEEVPLLPTTHWEVKAGVRQCGDEISHCPVGDCRETGQKVEPNTQTAAASPPSAVSVISVDVDDSDVMKVGEWKDRSIEVLLDSGCCRHIVPPSEVDGYRVRDSAGSRRGQNFIVGNGEHVPNEGEVHLNLEANTGHGDTRPVTSVFQVAELNCSLMSVSQICDHGYKCVFDKDRAQVIDEDGEVVCQFERDRNVYTTKMKVRPPTPFGRPER